MAGIYGASEVAGPGKKRNNPNSKAKVTARKTARKESGMSAKKFYVTTRMEEAAKSGKTLDKAALRKKFQSGEVTRKGFGAPRKSTGGTGTGSTGSTGVTATPSKYPGGFKDDPAKKFDPSKKQKKYVPMKPSGPKKYAK